MSSLFKKDKHEIEKSIKKCEEKCRNIEQLIETKYSNIETNLEQLIETKYGNIETKYSNLEQLIETKYSNLEQLIETKYGNLEQLIETKYNFERLNEIQINLEQLFTKKYSNFEQLNEIQYNLEELIKTKYGNLEQLIGKKYVDEINLLNTLNQKINDDTKSKDIYDYLKKLDLQILNVNETIRKQTISKIDQAPLVNVINNMSQNFTNLLVQIHNDLKSELKSNLKNNDTCDEQCIKQLISESNEDLLSNMSTQSNKYLNHVIDVNNQLTKNIKDLEQVMLNVDKNINAFYFENELIKNQLHLAEEINKWSDEVNTIRELAIQCKQSVDEIILNEFNNDEYQTHVSQR